MYKEERAVLWKRSFNRRIHRRKIVTAKSVVDVDISERIVFKSWSFADVDRFIPLQISWLRCVRWKFRYHSFHFLRFSFQFLHPVPIYNSINDKWECTKVTSRTKQNHHAKARQCKGQILLNVSYDIFDITILLS
ncbi:hypothetical protein NPIL_11031 [Nephila pilipes]|uniref:Uncharacterized protein n=1 Tax=Nephila pilipes TaxID=299642 RepID=A0A8X6UB05_NEPPI|nr:hypothetical protein NPIL_11031 [Nephila pilipes]